MRRTATPSSGSERDIVTAELLPTDMGEPGSDATMEFCGQLSPRTSAHGLSPFRIQPKSVINLTPMNLALRKPMTLAEFLEWEERQPMRYEFDGVGPVAMTGGTAGHADVQRNLAIAIGGRLQGTPCRFYGSDLKFQVAEGHIRYPDGMVVCSLVDRNPTVIYDPVVVFEVLSPSTTRYDRIVKAREYQATPSVQRYVMLEQDGVGATVYARSDGAWTHEILVADTNLALPEIGVSLPLAELYEGLVFDAGQDGDQPPAAGSAA
jgi:Uma2 family endonuclease